MKDLSKPGPLPSPAEVAHGVLDVLIEEFSDPAYRAGVCVSVGCAIAMARAGFHWIPAVALATMAGAATEHVYGMVADIHGKLTGEDRPVLPR